MALLLTDGNLRATLAAVRGLGEAGIKVTVAAETATSLAGCSRYCSGTVLSPSPTEEPEAFADFLRRQVAGGEYEMVLPMSDVSVRIAADVIADYPAAAACIPFPATDVVAGIQDKARVIEVARHLGIACPREFTPGTGALEDFAARLPYPVVLKPVRSRFFRDGRWHAASVSYAFTPAEFVSRFAAARSAGQELLVQEYIAGEGRGVFLLMWEGEIKAAFCHRRLREKPPWGGVSVFSESLPLNTSLVHQSAALLRAFNWHGPAMVEFKFDRNTGRPVLMEINGRFWGSLQLAIDAGVNFPFLLYLIATGARVEQPRRYRMGLRSRWLLGDLAQLVARACSPRTARQFATGPSLLSSALAVCQIGGGNLRYESPRRGDLGPFAFELRIHRRKIAGLLALLGRKPRKAAPAGISQAKEVKA